MSDISFGRSVISTGWSGSITGGRSEEEHYGPEQRREDCHIMVNVTPMTVITGDRTCNSQN